MKKSARIFLFIIILMIIIIGASITKNLIKDNKNYKGELIEASPRPQNISIFVLPTTPLISIISPENKTYSTNTILLNYSIINEPDFIWYNLDNGINITINSSLEFTATKQTHTLYLYANNSQGVSFKNISFSVKITPPQPPEDEEYGGGDWPINKTKPSENITPTETPKTEKPKKTTMPIKLIIIILISFIFLVLLIFLIIILIAEIKKKKDKEKIKRKRGKRKIKKIKFSSQALSVL
jgi:Na+-transporting methylmalonyl-CoA/oxaloacetate decarboxylase gamma subunit